MLTVETIGRIRREHFLKGKTIKEIARDLGVSRNTVRKVLRSGETSFEYERTYAPGEDRRRLKNRVRRLRRRRSAVSNSKAGSRRSAWRGDREAGRARR